MAKWQHCMALGCSSRLRLWSSEISIPDASGLYNDTFHMLVLRGFMSFIKPGNPQYWSSRGDLPKDPVMNSVASHSNGQNVNTALEPPLTGDYLQFRIKVECDSDKLMKGQKNFL